MASSSEAFEKLRIWKKDKIWLNVTVIERDAPEYRLYACVFGVDEDAFLVGLAGKEMHSFSRFDVGDAEFSIEPEKLTVSRGDAEWLIFEVAGS